MHFATIEMLLSSVCTQSNYSLKLSLSLLTYEIISLRRLYELLKSELSSDYRLLRFANLDLLLAFSFGVLFIPEIGAADLQSLLLLMIYRYLGCV